MNRRILSYLGSHYLVHDDRSHSFAEVEGDLNSSFAGCCLNMEIDTRYGWKKVAVNMESDIGYDLEKKGDHIQWRLEK